MQGRKEENFFEVYTNLIVTSTLFLFVDGVFVDYTNKYVYVSYFLIATICKNALNIIGSKLKKMCNINSVIFFFF